MQTMVKQTPFDTILAILFEHFNMFDHDVNVFKHSDVMLWKG